MAAISPGIAYSAVSYAAAVTKKMPPEGGILVILTAVAICVMGTSNNLLRVVLAKVIRGPSAASWLYGATAAAHDQPNGTDADTALAVRADYLKEAGY